MTATTDIRAVALVPARSGSSRVADKNVRVLAGHPMIAYTICAARSSGVFDSVIVSTDAEHYAKIARHYGAEVPFLRPVELARDDSPDIGWISHLLGWLADRGREPQAFAILRPTSPLRGPQVITDAMARFLADDHADSLRAVEPVSQHPGKMWTIDRGRLVPLLGGEVEGVPWHSSPTQFLPKVWVQNASLEIAWTRCVTHHGTIAGQRIVAFENLPPDGFDVNTAEDWERLQRLVAADPSLLPAVDVRPFGEITDDTEEHTRG